MCNKVESKVRIKADSNGESCQFSLLKVIRKVGSKREEK